MVLRKFSFNEKCLVLFQYNLLILAIKKTKKRSPINGSNDFDPLSVANFREIPLDVAIRILKNSGINVSEEEASEILALAHTLAKITIKEFILNQD